MSDATSPTASALPDLNEDQASPQLIWADDGSPRSGRFGDVYFSKEDGLSETRAVFLTGCGLPEAWSGRQQFTVAELGYGTGLNIIALIHLWRQHRPTDAHLNIFSIEGFPLSHDEARRALGAWPELADTAEALLDQWPSGTPGFHRIDLPQWGIRLDLAIGDVNWALEQWSGLADAWFLDGFSPALNPGMWSEEVMQKIGRRSAPGARLATFTVAGLVRRGLTAQGFVVEKKPGFGRKRERLEAHLPGQADTPASRPHVAILGAGIAGASMVRALKNSGSKITIVEAEHPGHGGSGFPAALVTPRLDAGDDIIASIHAQALSRARTLYEQSPGVVLATGVLQLEQSARDSLRFDKISAQPLWAKEAMQRLDPACASEQLGEALSTGGLLMADAMAIKPAAVLEAWLEEAPRLTARVHSIHRHQDQWQLRDENGASLLTADVLVITAGWGTSALLPNLPLKPVAGQADWAEGLTTPPVAWGGYAVPTESGLLFGATHEREVTSTTPSHEASAQNLDTLSKVRPLLARQIDLNSPATHRRKAVRATTPDRLPLSGSLSDAPGLYVLGGLGSRGFCVAPLLAEDIAAQILGCPSPLPLSSRQRLSPNRFTKTLEQTI